MKLILSALAALLLAGCASMPADQRLDMYRANAGATMASFRYYGTIYSWEPLGDSAVALWTRPAEAYLLELSGPCNDLEITRTIGLTDRTGRVYAGFDKVLVLNQNPVNIPCRIMSIRPLDVASLKQAERDQASSGT